MKKDIYPAYHKTIVHCACGSEFETGSTMKEIKVRVCSTAIPVYRQAEAYGFHRKVERFRNKYAQFNKGEAKADKSSKVTHPPALPESPMADLVNQLW
jgi:large subunit ribosomal protein L31